MKSNQVRKSTVKISNIVIDHQVQQRMQMNLDTVAEYLEVIEEAEDGWPFPPLDVFRIGREYQLADGFHRITAAQDYGLEKVPVKVHIGKRDDAILFAVRANITHGLRRTNTDKARAVNTLLSYPEWQGRSDREIAREAGVHHQMVGKLRQFLEYDEQKATEKAQAAKEPKPTPLDESSSQKRKPVTIDHPPLDESSSQPPKSKPRPDTPKKATQQAFNRFGGACADLRNHDLSPDEKYKVAMCCRDTLIWCLPGLRPKSADTMIKEICDRSWEVSHA